MRPVFIAFLLLLALALPAAARAESPAPDENKKAEVPFRADSGLITAEYYLATGKYTQALEVCARVLERHPENADAYTYRGYAYEKLGDEKKAKENYQSALKIDPSHLGANRYLAGIYLDEGNLQAAMDQLQALRMICGDADCEEIDDLEGEINRYKSSGAAPPKKPPPARRLVPDNHPYQNY